MHLWSSSGGGEDHLHDHRFPFSSCVVRGRIVNEVFELGVSGGEGEVQRTAVRETATISEGRWDFHAGSASVSLVRAARLQLDEGSTYSMQASTIHRTEVVESGTITLLLEGGHVATGTTVYVPDDQSLPHSRSQDTLGVDRCREILNSWFPHRRGPSA